MDLSYFWHVLEQAIVLEYLFKGVCKQPWNIETIFSSGKGQNSLGPWKREIVSPFGIRDRHTYFPL